MLCYVVLCCDRARPGVRLSARHGLLADAALVAATALGRARPEALARGTELAAAAQLRTTAAAEGRAPALAALAGAFAVPAGMAPFLALPLRATAATERAAAFFGVFAAPGGRVLTVVDLAVQLPARGFKFGAFRTDAGDSGDGEKGKDKEGRFHRDGMVWDGFDVFVIEVSAALVADIGWKGRSPVFFMQLQQFSFCDTS